MVFVMKLNVKQLDLGLEHSKVGLNSDKKFTPMENPHCATPTDGHKCSEVELPANCGCLHAWNLTAMLVEPT